MGTSKPPFWFFWAAVWLFFIGYFIGAYTRTAFRVETTIIPERVVVDWQAHSLMFSTPEMRDSFIYRVYEAYNQTKFPN